MTRRATSAASGEAETDPNAPPLAIPLGTQADVQIKYRTNVDPNQDGRARGTARSELEDLAALAEEGEELPMDEVSAFCQRWANFAGQALSIIRLADPPERRLVGNAYAHPCFNAERLGDTSFDPDNLISTLQFVNRNSGGVFRIWLNYNGAPVPEARIERLAIGDPPGSHAPNANAQPLIQPLQPAPQPAYQPPQKSDSERQLDAIKDQLFTKALERALNPPPPPIAAPGSGMSTEEQATLFLLGKTDFLGSIFGKMTDLAQQAGSVTREPSWKDRAIDAGFELATKNPAIVERLGGVVERIVARVLPDPRLDGIPQPQFPQHQPTQPPQQTYQTEPLPVETAKPEDGQDDDTMDIIEELTALLNSATPLTLADPLFLDLQKRYPVKFRIAIKAIASFSLDDVIEWIKDTGGPVYVSMLEGPYSGPYLRQRLSELQGLIMEGKKKHDEKQGTTTTAPTPEPKNEQS